MRLREISGEETEEAGGADSREAPLVAVIMGSTSDWETMRHASEVLKDFGVPHECSVVSAHRTPAWMAEFAAGAEGRGLEVIIAGAGGAAHLPGMVAAQTLLPVFGVPVKSKALKGLDSLLSIVQMPAGIPVGTLAIGQAGATNAALLAVAVLANTRPDLRERLRRFREEQTARVREAELPT
jgi:5-(carboxyamino)imidazole ribonucleotide mutase